VPAAANARSTVKWAEQHLLALDGVTKRVRRGRREHVVLDDVTIHVEPGELVAVWGPPRSGRTTLLRVAAGLERPDAGAVRFDGVELARRRELCDGIGFVQPSALANSGQPILDHVAMPLLARGVAPAEARRRAWAELERVGAAACSRLLGHDLRTSELVRVAIAEAVVAMPRLLLVDDPTRQVYAHERAPVFALLRAIADSGTAVLMVTGDAMGVSCADRAMTIGDGVVHVGPVAQPAPVIPLRRASEATALSGRP